MRCTSTCRELPSSLTHSFCTWRIQTSWLTTRRSSTTCATPWPRTVGPCTWWSMQEQESAAWCHIYGMAILYTALIWSAKNFVLQPCWRVFVYFKFAHSSTQTKQHIYLKNVILAFIMGSVKIAKNKMPVKNTCYTVTGHSYQEKPGIYFRFA